MIIENQNKRKVEKRQKWVKRFVIFPVSLYDPSPETSEIVNQDRRAWLCFVETREVHIGHGDWHRQFRIPV